MSDLKRVAEETLAAIANDGYVARSGRAVSLGGAAANAVAKTILYRPVQYSELSLPRAHLPAPRVAVEVTTETTAQAGRRLVQTEGVEHVVALNFASAKHAGGGFLRGAKAQEEDLARCSALYSCLRDQHVYYEQNRASGSPLYTDHLIYSPDVPFFRDDSLRWLETPFPLSIITSPAPHRGEALALDPEPLNQSMIFATLLRRARQILRVAAHHGHRSLVLGAWGCGVFRNDPVEVADAFADALAAVPAFDRVVFAIYDPGGSNLAAFEKKFGRAQLL